MNDSSSPVPSENPVMARLRQGLPALGITLTANSVEAAPQAADLGFDLLISTSGSVN